MDVKGKGIASVGFWVNCAIANFDSIQYIDFGFVMAILKIVVSQARGSDWCETIETNQSDFVPTICHCPSITPMTLDLKGHGSSFAIVLFREREDRSTWNQRDVNRSFITMTMTFGRLGWLNVRDSGRGDITRRRGVNTSNLGMHLRGIWMVILCIATPFWQGRIIYTYI